jgi:hypothetical protein
MQIHNTCAGPRLLLALLLLSFSFAQEFTLQDSTVTYSARDAQGSWQGRAPLSSLSLRAEPDGLRVSAELEPGAFSSGNFIRDGNARFTVFEVNRYPTATLSGVLPLTPEMLAPAPESQPQETRTQSAQFRGQLTLHGITRDLSFPVTVTRSGFEARAQGSFAVQLSDFEMRRPSLFGVVVDDRVEVSVSLSGSFGGE